MLPPLVDAVSSMTSRGWEVDVYLVLGYDLLPERRELIDDALQRAAGDSARGVGLEVWEDAIPFYYENTFNKRPREGQSLVNGDHALSRQHRFVLRDKLSFYDFFVCFVSDNVVTLRCVSSLRVVLCVCALRVVLCSRLISLSILSVANLSFGKSSIHYNN